MLINFLNGLVGVLGNLLDTLGGSGSSSPLPTSSQQAIISDSVNDQSKDNG
ncbi:MAG: hypothetical protein LOD88_07535 [Novibacillus thermophilus]|uniref:hypothetical protein n=1 Tax=Novibacillus thermophilus TaxID=1471761 RepID=UPI001476365A|nr:hypothetical protein [Novibacillus thermophilus]